MLTIRVLLLFVFVISFSDFCTGYIPNLKFLNSGKVRAGDKYEWKKLPCNYLESQNVSGFQNNWADRGNFNYLFQNQNGQLNPPPTGIRSSVPLGGKFNYNLY